MLSHIESEGLAEEKIIMMDVTDILAQSHTGLVANKLASQFKRPVILLRDKKNDETSYGGSGRNYSRFAVGDLNGFLTATGQFESVSGK